MLKIIREDWADERKLSDEEINNFWEEITSPSATIGRITDILLKCQDYYLYLYDGDGTEFMNNVLPKLIQNGIKFGIPEEKLNKAREYLEKGKNSGINPWNEE